MNEEALKARLKFIAKEKDKPFNQVWKELLLERFLARLSASQYRDKFIFKGGLLLATHINIARETMDIDFLLTKLNREADSIKTATQKIIGTDLSDGFHFSWDRLTTLQQPHMQYKGFRILLMATFGKMKDKIQIDIGIFMQECLHAVICFRGSFGYKMNSRVIWCR